MIYKIFIKLEIIGIIEEYEKILIKEERERLLRNINEIIKKKDSSVEITMSNINDYFKDKYEIYIGDIDLNLINKIKVTNYYKTIKSNKSFKYESLYKEVHNGD